VKLRLLGPQLLDTLVLVPTPRVDFVCAFQALQLVGPAFMRIDIVRTLALNRLNSPLPEEHYMQVNKPTDTNGSPRDININIRAKRTQRDLIDQAAEALGKSRSDFMLETACREAEDVLLDKRVFMLDSEAFEKFQAILNSSPSKNPKLQKLMATLAPWEE